MSDWLRWLLLPVLLFVAVGGGAMTAASIVAAVMPAATWPQTNRAAIKAGAYGSAAVVAVLLLMRIWP